MHVKFKWAIVEWKKNFRYGIKAKVVRMDIREKPRSVTVGFDKSSVTPSEVFSEEEFVEERISAE